MIDLSVVIPVYNEEETIEEVIRRVQKLPLEKEIILVDDNSSDGSTTILKKYQREENMKVVFFSENRGKGAALREGFKHVSGLYTVVQDGDLEYNPEDLVKMYKVAEEKDAKVVYGNRFWKGGKPKGMAWGNYIFNLILARLATVLYGQKISDAATCYKMFKTDFLKGLALECEGFEFCSEVTAKSRLRGERIFEVPVSYTPRTLQEGKKIRPWHALDFFWALLKYRL